MQLYQFIIIFGILMLVLVQIPSFHSLRHINLISLVLCLAYSACATAGSIYLGKKTCQNNKPFTIDRMSFCYNHSKFLPYFQDMPRLHQRRTILSMELGKIGSSDPSMRFQSSPPHMGMELFLRYR